MQNVSGELIVSGLDSATSLIQAAKNLMNAVVLCVKASYVASTKYPRQAIAEGIVGKPIVVWKMRVRIAYYFSADSPERGEERDCLADKEELTVFENQFLDSFYSEQSDLIFSVSSLC